MPIQAPQWTDFRLCPVCQNEYNTTQKPPISLGCGHSICQSCLFRLSKQQCPFDQAEIQIEIKKLPINYALLSLVGGNICDSIDVDVAEVKQHQKEFDAAKKAIEVLAQSLQNVVITGTPSNSNNNYSTGNGVLTRPMQRKLVTLIHTQLAEGEGRSRALRAARSIGERAVKELILMHQNPQTLSTALWAAVRQRGCQFLGPAMQEAVLQLIVLSLEDGISLSRKVLVLFVVQRLEKQFTQASKTSIGHVVQLLYRASCFKVTKREGDSSLLQLQEKYRTYSALRKEHDAQIVQIAMEAGLHISPEQWSALLYGDDEHKSHMQSIIDKLQTPASFASSIQELIIALQRTNDPHDLQSLRHHLDKLAAIDPSPDAVLDSWEQLEESMESLLVVVTGLQSYSKEYASRNKGNLEGAQMINTKYRTSMCRDILQKNSCPRGTNCNFAHSDEELDKYRKRRNLPNGRPHMIHNNSINSNTNLNGMMAPYPTSRAGSSSSPDSCINGDLDDELIEINKISHHQQTTRSEVTGMGINGHRNHPVYMEQDNQMISQMKNMAINGQSFNYPPQQQISPSQHSIPKKAELTKYPPGYTGNLNSSLPPPPPQMHQQRQPPSVFTPVQQQQQQQSYQGGFYEMREPHSVSQPPPPQPPQQMYLQRNQHAFVTNAPPVYQQQQQQQQHHQQYNNGYMQQYPQHPSMDFPAFHDNFGGHATMQRTAVGARGGSASDHSDLIKSSANPSELSSLSISVKDEEWKHSRGTKPYDGMDSGRGSSNGYHSSSDTFSPLSNASLGSRSSPPNIKPETGCSKMFGNGIWSSEPKTNGWTTGKSNGWDLLENNNMLSDVDDRNSSSESLGKSSDHQSTTLDDERMYSEYLQNLSRSSTDLLNNNTTTSNQTSSSQNFMDLLSPTLSRRPPPGFGLS